MATEYTITYTFKGQSNTSTSRSVAFDRFEAEGDTDRAIEQIISIQYVHYHTSTGGAWWKLRGRLVFGDGTTLESDFVNQRIERGNVVGYTNTFTELPTKEQFENLIAVQTLDTKGKTTAGGYEDDLYWRANSTHPMKLIVKFIDEPPVVYAPKIEKFQVDRVGDDGFKNDEGEYIATTLKLSVGNSAGLNIAKCKIYIKANNYPNTDKDTPIDVLKEVTMSQLTSDKGIELNKDIIAGKHSLGSVWNCAVVFEVNGEIAIAASSVARGTTSLHISDHPGGGAAVGGFSTGTTANPKFESYVPAHFYGGVNGLTDYSTGEVKTLYKWVDGRTIYRKVIKVKDNTFPANTPSGSLYSTIYTFGASVEVINIFGYINRPGGTYRFTPSWYGGDNNYHIVWMEDTQKLVVKSKSQAAGYLAGHIIIEYVK